MCSVGFEHLHTHFQRDTKATGISSRPCITSDSMLDISQLELWLQDGRLGIVGPPVVIRAGAQRQVL